MPFEFEIERTAAVVLETWTGLVDLNQLKDSCLQEWAHRDYKNRMPMLSGFRQATAQISPKGIVQFAMWFGDNDPPAKHAIVVARESGFGFAKMFALMADAAKKETNATRVFYSCEEAAAWLGLPENTQARKS